MRDVKQWGLAVLLLLIGEVLLQGCSCQGLPSSDEVVTGASDAAAILARGYLTARSQQQSSQQVSLLTTGMSCITPSPAISVGFCTSVDQHTALKHHVAVLCPLLYAQRNRTLRWLSCQGQCGMSCSKRVCCIWKQQAQQ
jgi:hypothetical protein